MNASLDQILTTYTDEELDLLAKFLDRTRDAGREATDALTSE
jgi:hypothetical protein